MVRLLTQRCIDCGDRDGSIYSGTVDVYVDIAVAYSRAVYGQDTTYWDQVSGTWGHNLYHQIGD